MVKGRIAVLMPEIYDYLNKELLSGVQSAATQMGYDTIVFTGGATSDADSYMAGENNIYELPFACGIDGIILAANRVKDKKLKASLFRQLESYNCPCVAIGEMKGSVSGVFLEQDRAVYEVTEHLICYHGHKNLLCLSGPANSYEAQERAKGFVRAMKKHGIYSEGQVIYGDFGRNSALELADRIINGEVNKPEAIVCANDFMALVLCQRFLEQGIKVPEDIAITGYDGSRSSLLATPSITTVSGSDYCLGIYAVKKLLQQMGENSELDAGLPKIRFRRSCGCENDAEERASILLQTEALFRNQRNKKQMVLSNFIAKMSDCESLPKFALALDELREMLPNCSTMNVCLCEDWNVEETSYRASGFSEKMSIIYSESQPGELMFPLVSLLPQLNLPHKPQFWVFTSLHYLDRIMGYIASSYEHAEQFFMEEHYISWCDAVANGLDILAKKQTMLSMWKRMEEKNLTAIYTGLLTRKEFVSNLKKGDTVMLFAFPDTYVDRKYAVLVISAVLRSEEKLRGVSMHFRENVFGVVLQGITPEEFSQVLRDSLLELGIHISREELRLCCEILEDPSNADEWLAHQYEILTEKSVSRGQDFHYKSFLNLRREIEYSPQKNWTVSAAAKRIGLSGSHFQRLYKQHFMVSFTEELIRFRLKRAKYLLCNTEMTINQISQECGYITVAHFMRQFKERMGKSAGCFRKEEWEKKMDG